MADGKVSNQPSPTGGCLEARLSAYVGGLAYGLTPQSPYMHDTYPAYLEWRLIQFVEYVSMTYLVQTFQKPGY